MPKCNRKSQIANRKFPNAIVNRKFTLITTNYHLSSTNYHVLCASLDLTTPLPKSNLLMSISSTVNGFAVFQPPRV